MFHRLKSRNKGKVNYPNLANDGLGWGTLGLVHNLELYLRVRGGAVAEKRPRG